MTRSSLPPGPTMNIGPYQHAHRIAVGGMAEVFRALAPQAAGGDRAVVLKRLLPELSEDPAQRAMFEHEAELGARIDHPNVVAVLGHGAIDDRPFIALEYVFGVDLFLLMRWMRHEKRRFEPELALWLGTELLSGLTAVHEVADDDGRPLEVVHRDVSPANVFLSVHGDVKLGDLGIARAALGRSGAPSMRAKGKLGYLPPEQVAGREVDQRGDVFSAAVVVAELLMGRPLFAGGTELGVLLAIRDGDVSAFRAVAPDLPGDVGDALLAALARRPKERMPTARALRARIAPAVTRPRERLRRELGALVVGALDDAGTVRDDTSLARTIEEEAKIYEQITPAAVTHADALRESGPLYRVDRDGKPLGVFTLAALVRALTTGDVQALDSVRTDDGEGRPIAAVAELSRHLPASSRTPDARRRVQMAQTGELYDLGSRSMLHVLVQARLARESGLLLCEQDSVRKEIYLADGLPCFATSNQPGELLGERLVSEGRIDRAELDMALAVMPRFEGRLGETLVALGLVDAVTLFGIIGDQVRDRLLAIFQWDRGHAALYRHVDAPERAFPLDQEPWELLIEGMERRFEAGLDPMLVPTSRPLAPGELDPRSLGLPPLLEGIVLACQRPRTIDQLGAFDAPPATLRAAVAVLLELGALRWDG